MVESCPAEFFATHLKTPESLDVPSVIRSECKSPSSKTFMCGKAEGVIFLSSLYHVTVGVGLPIALASKRAALPLSMERSFKRAVNTGASFLGLAFDGAVDFGSLTLGSSSSVSRSTKKN